MTGHYEAYEGEAHVLRDECHLAPYLGPGDVLAINLTIDEDGFSMGELTGSLSSDGAFTGSYEIVYDWQPDAFCKESYTTSISAQATGYGEFFAIRRREIVLLVGVDDACSVGVPSPDLPCTTEYVGHFTLRSRR